MRRAALVLAAALLRAVPAGAQQPPPAPAQKQLPPTITLPSELVTEIALYLQERPYREVAGLLGALQQVIAEQTRGAEPQQSGPPPATPPAPERR